MSASASQSSAMEKKAAPHKKARPKKNPKPITWEVFQRKYLTKEDGFKYEWLNGKVEKTKRTMDKSQLYLLWNLLEHFDFLKSKNKVAGRLIAEPDLFFLKNHRRPDIAWLTKEQTFNLAESDAYEVPAFIIEVISSNDQVNKLKTKMQNYRDAGVKTVWHIFPKLKQVDVYAGENLEKMTVCLDKKICSAAPGLPGFEISVEAIFQKTDTP